MNEPSSSKNAAATQQSNKLDFSAILLKQQQQQQCISILEGLLVNAQQNQTEIENVYEVSSKLIATLKRIHSSLSDDIEKILTSQIPSSSSPASPQPSTTPTVHFASSPSSPPLHHNTTNINDYNTITFIESEDCMQNMERLEDLASTCSTRTTLLSTGERDDNLSENGSVYSSLSSSFSTMINSIDSGVLENMPAQQEELHEFLRDWKKGTTATQKSLRKLDKMLENFSNFDDRLLERLENGENASGSLSAPLKLEQLAESVLTSSTFVHSEASSPRPVASSSPPVSPRFTLKTSTNQQPAQSSDASPKAHVEERETFGLLLGIQRLLKRMISRMCAVVSNGISMLSMEKEGNLFTSSAPNGYHASHKCLGVHMRTSSVQFDYGEFLHCAELPLLMLGVPSRRRYSPSTVILK